MNTAYLETYFSHVPASLVSGVFAVSIAIAIAIMITIMIRVIIIIAPPGMAWLLQTNTRS